MEKNHDLWLIRPKPKPHEALSSWLVRLADANGQGLHSFCTDHWPQLALWNRDVDHHAPFELLASLGNATGVGDEIALSTTFRRYQNVLFEGDDPITTFGYVRPLGVYHRLRRAYGQQFCAQCLACDAEPNFRLSWRLTLFPTCTRHGKILLDRCTQCASPIMPHRGGLTRCHNCRAMLAEMPQIEAGSRALVIQARHESILAGHPVCYPNALLGLHPLLYFRLILCVASVLVLGKRCNRFRAAASAFLDWPLPELDPSQAVEMRFLSPELAHDALFTADALLAGWPARFVGAAQEAGLWQSWAFRDKDPARTPFAYLDPVRRYLRTEANAAKRDYSAARDRQAGGSR